MTDPTALPNLTPGGQPSQPQPEPEQAIATFAGPDDESPLRDNVVQVLEGEGFRPEVDTDGDVSFKVEGQQLFIRCMDGEPSLLRVFGQWQVADLEADLLKRLNAANDITLSLNIIKVGIAGGNLVVSGEHIVTADTDLVMVLQSTSAMILQAVQLWHQAATSDGPHASAAPVQA
ncbi:hypothetical protein [Calidifontibacter terrae]